MRLKAPQIKLKAALIATAALTVVIAIAVAFMPASSDTSPKSGASFLTLARYVSVRDAENSVWFYDYARARDLAGIEAPAPGADQDAIRKYGEAIMAKTVTYANPLSRLSSPATDWRAELGFTLSDIDQALWTDGLVVAGGHFDANKVETAVRTTSSVAKIVTSAEHSGVHYLTWEKQLPPTAPWLEPQRLVPGNQVVYWSSQRSLIERSIDASRDPQLSLRRLPELQLLADAFDDLGVYTAQYNFGLEEDWFSDYRDIIEGAYGAELVGSQTQLEPYDALVVGVGQEGHSAYAVLILVQADEKAAKANAGKLQQIVKSGVSFHTGRPWREQIEKAEITAKGRLVYAKFYSANLRLTFDAWQNLDSLILQ